MNCLFPSKMAPVPGRALGLGHFFRFFAFFAIFYERFVAKLSFRSSGKITVLFAPNFLTNYFRMFFITFNIPTVKVFHYKKASKLDKR